MIRLLVDHNIEGQAVLLLGTLTSEGWQGLFSMEFVTFSDADLPYEGNDRMVWRYAQENNLIFLTENRNMSGRDSLEQTLREENIKSSMPVLTIGNVNRRVEKNYRKRCATSALRTKLLNPFSWVIPECFYRESISFRPVDAR